MQIDASHCLPEARHCVSPNCNERPDAEDISLIVVHGISLPPEQFGGAFIDQLFTNQLNPAEHPYFAEIAHLRVSAHVLIRRDGELVQYVPFNQRAWHAGLSSYLGRENCNDFSIGIELEGSDTQPYTAAQYHQLAHLLTALQAHYPRTRGHIAGHSDIAPGRKTDPGPSFDWALLHQELARLERA